MTRHAIVTTQGGCQAILMEIVGGSLAKEQLKPPPTSLLASSTTFAEQGAVDIVLESMSIDYISAGGRRSGCVITIEAMPITKTQMRVTIYSENKSIVSIGRLVWSTATTTILSNL